MRKIKVNQTDKIFVQLASYRDPQLVPTINDALKKAANPERLVLVYVGNTMKPKI